MVVRTLRNKQGVVDEVSPGGRYRVRVGGVAIWCREDDLAAADAGSPKKRKRASPPETGRPGRTPAERRGPPARLDLHGLRVDDALARVDAAIDRALLDDVERLEVVHGLGTGRIRDALHRHLGSLTVVAAFRLDPANPGVTWVYF